MINTSLYKTFKLEWDDGVSWVDTDDSQIERVSYMIIDEISKRWLPNF